MDLLEFAIYLLWVFTVLVSAIIIALGIQAVIRFYQQILKEKRALQRATAVWLLFLINLALSILFFLLYFGISPFITDPFIFFHITLLVIGGLHLGITIGFLYEFLRFYFARNSRKTWFQLFIVLRISVSPIIFLYPFWGVIAFGILDMLDSLVYKHTIGVRKPFLEVIGKEETRSYYDKYDKIADIANEIVMVIFVWIVWQDIFMVGLFLWRVVGIVIWYFKPDNRWLFVIFPNVFANFFIVRAFVYAFLPASLIWFETYFVIFFSLTLVITLLYEYLVHIIQYEGLSWEDSFRKIKKYLVFVIFGISAIYIGLIPPPFVLLIPQWLLIPLFFGGYVLVFFVYHKLYYRGYNSFYIRHGAWKEQRFSLAIVKVFILCIFTVRIVISFIFPFEWILVYFIIQETIDYVDSVLIINLKYEGVWRASDDLVDWVSRLIFFLPLFYLNFLPFLFVYFFVVIGFTFIHSELRWLKVFGINPLYVMGFYIFLPNFFYHACAISFVMYFLLFYKSRKEVEAERNVMKHGKD